MKSALAPRQILRIVTDLAAITAVSIIFAVGATKAGIGADASDLRPPLVAKAHN